MDWGTNIATSLLRDTAGGVALACLLEIPDAIAHYPNQLAIFTPKHKTARKLTRNETSNRVNLGADSTKLETAKGEDAIGRTFRLGVAAMGHRSLIAQAVGFRNTTGNAGIAGDSNRRNGGEEGEEDGNGGLGELHFEGVCVGGIGLARREDLLEEFA